LFWCYVIVGTWDLIGEVTWGKSMGFVESGDDDGMIQTAELSMMYLGLVGQLPWCARLLRLNPYRPPSIRKFDWLINFSVEKVTERIAAEKSSLLSQLDEAESGGGGAPNDYLDSLLRGRKSAPETLTDVNIAMYIMTNVSLQPSYVSAPG
jgi:hypothetical protein